MLQNIMFLCIMMKKAGCMKFINRQKEMSRLDHLVSLDEAGVVVIWGRRRVGKTRLLLEWAKKHRGVYYTADESTSDIQRKYFSFAIDAILPGFSDVEYPDWTSCLNRLAKDAKQSNQRGPIIIDELPYLIASSPELPSILQRFIDKEAKESKLLIALCGSSQHMMHGAILDESAPLYGRADELIKLGPIFPGYMQDALRMKTAREVVESYSVWGGIPKYWELVERNEGDFFEKIEKIALDPMGALSEEPTRLLAEESPSAINLRPILDAIGLGCHRLSEVSARIGQPSTSLTRPVGRLIDLDLVLREIPFGEDASNSKKALYKIGDPFVRFWFEVVASRRSFLAQATSSFRCQLLKKALPSLFSITWEELCRLALPRLSSHFEDQTSGAAGRFWFGKGPEWDILAQSEDKKILWIGEAKWTVKTPSVQWIYEAIGELKGKGIPPIHRHPQTRVIYLLFVPEKPKGLELSKDVRVIDAKEVLEVLR